MTSWPTQEPTDSNPYRANNAILVQLTRFEGNGTVMDRPS